MGLTSYFLVELSSFLPGKKCEDSQLPTSEEFLKPAKILLLHSAQQVCAKFLMTMLNTIHLQLSYFILCICVFFRFFLFYLFKHRE